MQRAGAVASSSAGRTALLAQVAQWPGSSQCFQTQRRWSRTATATRPYPNDRFLLDPRDQRNSSRPPVVQLPNASTPLGDLTAQLVRATRAGEIIQTFKTCKTMKDRGIRPTAETYNALFRLLHQLGQHDVMYAIFSDMEAAEVEPDIETFNLMLNAARYNDLDINIILNRMADEGVQRSAITYQYHISYYADFQNLEMCLSLIDEMTARKLQPTLYTIEEVTDLAARLNYPRIGMELALAYEEESIRRLPPSAWMKMLSSSAALYYVEGVETCWLKGVVDGLATPDEGLCIDILNVAARAGRPDLATDVIRTLRKIGVIFREHHLAPVLESFMQAGNLKDALATLSLMRQSSITPNENTVQPILQHIVRSVEEVDKAFYILEDLKKDGKMIDVSALNLVIRASTNLGDLQRAVGTYKEAERLGVTPTRDTFHYLLDACIKAQHFALGEKLFEEMSNAGIKPDPLGYEKMLLLSLTQENYEEAFYYLEEMKTKTQDIPARVYEAIIRKCVTAFDPRWKVAAEEMQQKGFSLSSKLLRFIERGGDEPPEGEQQYGTEGHQMGLF